MAAVAATAASAVNVAAASAAPATVYEYGTCVTHLVELSDHDGHVISSVVTNVGPLVLVILPDGQELLVLPPGLDRGLQGCPVRVP